MMNTRFFSSHAARAFVAGCALLTTSCGSEMLRTGRSPAMLVIEQMSASAGNSDDFATPLLSDVQVLVDTQVGGVTVEVPTTFNDLGRATMRVMMKAQPTLLNPVSPTEINAITINRYRVTYRRSDGRNTPGVDVPFGFDGATGVTIQPGSSGEVIFDLVRHSSKLEPPLRNLIAGGGLIFINTIAEITFFGRDQNGNEVTATGMVDVIFGDFGDEE
jgi:hypothetical protein